MRVRGVSIGGAGGPLPAVLGLPDGFPPGAALVVIQDYWGLNGNIESFVHRLGSGGDVAIAPDLYRGKMTEEPDEANGEPMRTIGS